MQIIYLKRITEVLRFLESNRKSFTQLQELRVSIKDPADETKWVDATEQATNPAIGIPEQLLRISTNFIEGIPPFKVGCYVNGAKKAEQTVNKKVDTEPVVRFLNINIPDGKTFGETEIGRLLPGAHRIEVVAISPNDTYRKISYKKIALYITIGEQAALIHPDWPDQEGSHDPTPPENPVFPIQPTIPPQSAPAQTRHVGVSINLSPYFMPIKNQQNTGACAAFAGASIAEYFINRRTRNISFENALSELFLWYNMRVPNDKDKNEGVYSMQTVPNSLSSEGVCLDAVWSWMPVERGLPTKFRDMPHDIGRGDPYAEALTRILSNYRDLPPNDPDLWVDELRNNNPVLIAIDVDQSFSNKRDGFYGARAGNILGGHALVIVGFTTDFPAPNNPRTLIPAFKIRNSWGKNWGENGYIWISRDLLVQLLIANPIVLESLLSDSESRVAKRRINLLRGRLQAADRSPSIRIVNTLDGSPADGSRFTLDQTVDLTAHIENLNLEHTRYRWLIRRRDQKNFRVLTRDNKSRRLSVARVQIPANNRYLGLGVYEIRFEVIETYSETITIEIVEQGAQSLNIELALLDEEGRIISNNHIERGSQAEISFRIREGEPPFSITRVYYYENEPTQTVGEIFAHNSGLTPFKTAIAGLVVVEYDISDNQGRSGIGRINIVVTAPGTHEPPGPAPTQPNQEQIDDALNRLADLFENRMKGNT